MNNRAIYPSYDDFTKDDEYAYCKEDYELFQSALDDVEKRTTRSINSLLQKYGFGNLKVDYFDIQDTEMDEDGFDIHATIFLDGRGISTSKVQYIDFTITGDVTVEYEQHEYLDHSQIRYNTISPPYEEFSIEIICPDLRKLTEFSIDSGREYKFSIKDFLAKIEEYIKMKKTGKKGSNNKRKPLLRSAANVLLEEDREETICDPQQPMACTGVLRFKNGKPIPAYVMLRGFLVGVAVAQNNAKVQEKYGQDVLDTLERAIRGWLRKASGNAEYTLSKGQKKWLNQTLGGKSGVLSPILRKYVITECSKSGGCDLPDPDLFRFANTKFQEGDVVWSQTGWSMKVANFYVISSIQGRKVFLKKLAKKQVSGDRQSWEVMPIIGSESSRLYQGALKGSYIQLKKEELMGWSGDPIPEWEVQHVHDQYRFASDLKEYEIVKDEYFEAINSIK